MKKRLVIPICLLLFVVGLLASLPARTVVQVLPLAAQGVYLAGVDGPWYRGSARLLQIQTPQGLLQFNDARWGLQWSALLGARVALDVQAQFDNRPLSAQVAVAMDQTLYVDQLNADVNLETIRPFMPQLSVPVSGAVSVRELSLQMPLTARWPESVQGRAAINNIVASLPLALLDLGSAELTLRGDASAIDVTISDYQGHYGLGGGISLSPPNIYQLAVTVQPDASIDEQTINGMRFVLGPPANGRYFLNYSGNW